MADPGEILRTTVRYTSEGASEQLNIFHHQVTNASASDTDVANTINAWIVNDWAPQWATLASSGSQLTDIAVDVVNVNGTIVRAIGTFLIGQLGAVASDVHPAATAAYMLLKTTFPKTRGVKYLPGLAEAVTNNGVLTPAALADLALLLIEYATTLNSAGATDLLPGVPSPSNLAFVPFLDTGIVQDVPAYQRRRKPNVGS